MDDKFKIGDVEIPNRWSLAPMAGLNCTSFMILSKENGAGLIFTQMYDVNLITKKTKEEVRKFLNIDKIERPIVIQLIGRDIKKINQSARLVEDMCDIININAGCIEKKYLDRGCGAALLKEPDKLCKIIRSLSDAVKIPVTVKIRIGWDSQNINAVKLCQDLEKSGAKSIIVHGRTAMQKYAGKANWEIMKQIKEKTSIPIIANGDIKSYEWGMRKLVESGCDGIMVGRESKYKPWIFHQEVMDNEKIRKQIFHFIDLYEKYENRFSLDEIKDHCFRMSRDFKTDMDKRKLKSLPNLKEIKKYIMSWK